MCIFLQKNSLKMLPLQKKITHTNLETPFFPTNQLIAICMRLPWKNIFVCVNFENFM